MKSIHKGKAPSPGNHPADMVQMLSAYQAAVNEAAIVSITDINGDITYVNEMFIRVSKYTAEELMGQNHRLINSGYHKKEFFRNMWQMIAAGKAWRGEIKNKAKDGTYYWVDTVITPIVDQNGTVFQYLSIRNLITAQKENEARLLQVQHEILKRTKQLKDAQRVAKTGSWYLDVSGDNQLEWSDETYHIFELAPGTKMTYNKFLEAVHPDDRNLVDKKWEQALKTGRYHIEHRIITKSGEKWVNEEARIEFDKKANLKRAVGTVQDITEKKKIDHSLRESEHLYKTLFNTSPFAVGIVDKKTMRFLEVNKTAIKLYGYSRAEFLKLSLFDIRVEDEHAKLKNQLINNYAGDRSIRSHKRKNGDIIQVEPTITPMTYRGHNVYLITITDITDKLKIEEELNLSKLNRQKEIIEAEERSRSQIGMELHDNVNQLLAASRLYIRQVKPSSAKNEGFIKTALDILSVAHEEIRKLSASLVAPTLSNNNLKESIEVLSKSYPSGNAKVQLNLRLNEASIPESLKTNIYRIVQEQFSNIIKHAAATKISITLHQYHNSIAVEIADNGKGFDLQTAKRGIGLNNITHRAEAYGGRVCIDTGIGQGCKINIRFDSLPVGGNI
ncbi:MAG: domain S-box-containing protein/diguanylate cyclase protein [Ferruginibacter sp.]|uniref:sensor histidine kinase n=1 Tax=Ferruginibacter sp. TaxID=1940288 RepID=UPI002657BFEC|nr:PAS domain S-box protein [Ferruginibacter sp.]MDB5276309.1 domain S-box-containing protein/diguanylate cyclase protein [Ferruginibacter sp.]